jgi:hypothetical protein
MTFATVGMGETRNTFVTELLLSDPTHTKTLSVLYEPTRVIFEYTSTNFMFVSTPVYFGGTVTKWPKYDEASPNWGLINRNTNRNMPGLIHNTASVILEFNIETPSTILYSDSTSNYYSYTTRMRSVSYTTNNANNMAYPVDVTNDIGKIVITSHNAVTSYSLQMGVDCINIAFTWVWSKINPRTWS